MDNNEKEYIKYKIINGLNLLISEVKNISEREKLEYILYQVKDVDVWWHD